MRRICLTAALSFAVIGPAAAEPLDGYFIAFEACEALRSKNSRTNPGNVETEPWHAYELREINKIGGAFYRVLIPGAPEPKLRWVHRDCGLHVVDAGTAPPKTSEMSDQSADPAPAAPESTNNLLTLSWQAAFCETRPGKEECEALNEGDLPHAMGQLSVHGLWPQPRGNDYCGVSQRIKRLDTPATWKSLPPSTMDADTSSRLAAAMPGLTSGLDRHEWIKHGTCYHDPRGEDGYYDDTLYLTEIINASRAVQHIVGNIGSEVDFREVREMIDAEFGEGAGARVEFHCRKDGRRNLLQEVWFHLGGVISETSDLGELLRGARATSIDCRAGIIDPAGLQ